MSRMSRRDGDVMVEFRDVSRRFTLHHETRNSFQDWFIGLVHPRGKGEEFWAVKDVSFQIRRGEAFGFLGRNGAGKSTILKLVTRVLEPTSGQIHINGHTHAMLELGAGFHPELSGRDNVYLNGSIYGFSRRQMREKFDAIVQFAELERFIDTPVKHYSSGMFMRLGFAIAVHMDPEILVIDEVMAVGDTAFQRKGYQALLDLKAAGTTILFVSHNSDNMRDFCDRAVLLEHGRLIDSGPAGTVVDHYLRMLEEEPAGVGILMVRPVDEAGAPTDRVASGDDLIVDVLVRVPNGSWTGDMQLALDLNDPAGTQLYGSTVGLPDELPVANGNDPTIRRVRGVFRGLRLAGGAITIAATLLRSGQAEPVDRQETEVDVEAPWSIGERGILRLEHDWEWETSDQLPASSATMIENGTPEVEAQRPGK